MQALAFRLESMDIKVSRCFLIHDRFGTHAKFFLVIPSAEEIDISMRIYYWGGHMGYNKTIQQLALAGF